MDDDRTITIVLARDADPGSSGAASINPLPVKEALMPGGRGMPKPKEDKKKMSPKKKAASGKGKGASKPDTKYGRPF
jgi:hypothetical protein